MGNTQPGRYGPFGSPFSHDAYRPAGPPYPPPDSQGGRFATPNTAQIESYPYQNVTTPYVPGNPGNQQNVVTQYPQDSMAPRGYYQQGYYQQGYPPQGYPQQECLPPGYPPPGYPQQGYYQQYPPVGQNPSMAQTTFCAACMACLTCLMCSCCQALMGVPADDSIAEGSSATPTDAQPQVSPPRVPSENN